MIDKIGFNNTFRSLLALSLVLLYLSFAGGSKLGKCGGGAGDCGSKASSLVLRNVGKEEAKNDSISVTLIIQVKNINVTRKCNSATADKNKAVGAESDIKYVSSENGTAVDMMGYKSVTNQAIGNITKDSEIVMKNHTKFPSIMAISKNDSSLQLIEPTASAAIVKIDTFGSARVVPPPPTAIEVNSSAPQMVNASIFPETVLPLPANKTGALLEMNSPLETASHAEALLQELSDSQMQKDSMGMKAPLIDVEPSMIHTKFVTKPKAPPVEHQFIPECGCRRSLFYSNNLSDASKVNSSCSDEGTHYAAGQKVISFSLPRSTRSGDYNKTSSYKANVKENLLRMRHFYPGYSMRLYTNLPLDKTYCRLMCQNIDLFWCDIRNSFGDQSQMFYPTWKFLPLGDPSVDIFLSRDVSTFINQREAAVVQDWLNLNKTFHLMRDKRRIHNFAILGGLWGGRNDLLAGGEGAKLRDQIILLSKTPKNKGYRIKDFDQDILSRVIFYPKKKDIVAYDSYHCKQWKRFTMVRPFPVQRNVTIFPKDPITRGFASAAVAAIRRKYKLVKCPLECRPTYGKNWEYC